MSRKNDPHITHHKKYILYPNPIYYVLGNTGEVADFILG
jgi:hypothetical protein